MDGAFEPETTPGSGWTRRRLLKNAAGVSALAVTPAILAACGGGGSSTGSTGASAGASGKVGGTLNYLGWQGGDYPQQLAPWRKAHGVNVKSSYINDMSDVAAKYAAGGGGYDIFGISSTGIHRLLGSGVPMMPLDLKQIPGYEGLIEFFKRDPDNAFKNEKGEVVAVPTAWSVMGITYDKTRVAAPKRWTDLLKPEFTNEITIIDGPSTCIGTAAALLGFKPNEMTKAQLEKCQELLAPYIAQAKSFSPSFGDMANQLAQGDVTAAFCGTPSVNVFAAEAGNGNIETAFEFPEGSASYAECYAVPEDSANVATAYSLINESLTPKVNAGIADFLIAGPAVEKATTLTNATVRSLYPSSAAAIVKYLETAPMVQDAPAQSDEFVTYGEVTQAWIELKGA